MAFLNTHGPCFRPLVVLGIMTAVAPASTRSRRAKLRMNEAVEQEIEAQIHVVGEDATDPPAAFIDGAARVLDEPGDLGAVKCGSSLFE